jgi:hypothetical protein
LDKVVKATKISNRLFDVQLDIAKAFDTVPHLAIDAVPRRLGLPTFISKTAMGSYKSINTTIHHNGGKAEMML